MKRTRAVKKAYVETSESEEEKLTEKPKDFTPKKTKIRKLKNESSSSSESDIGDYLLKPEKLDLNSEFFNTNESEFKKLEKKIFNDVSVLTDSESENEMEDIKETKEEKEIKKETATPKPTKSHTTPGSKLNFKQLQDYTKQMEEAKRYVEIYKAKKEAKENNTDILNLLAAGEGNMGVESNLKVSDLHSSDFESCDSDQENWEEIKNKAGKDGQEKSLVPQKELQITIDMPETVKKKKGVDLLAAMKRRLNRIRKENQILVHKVHLLCWIAHGNYVNSNINDTETLAMALSLLPSEHSYPSDRVDLSYLEQIVSWYKRTVKNIDKPVLEQLALNKSLQLQISRKEAYNKKMLAYIFVAILRALGIQCRIVISLQVEPLRPPASELHTVSTTNNEDIKKRAGEKKNMKSSGIKNMKMKAGTSKNIKNEVENKKISNVKAKKENGDKLGQKGGQLKQEDIKDSGNSCTKKETKKNIGDIKESVKDSTVKNVQVKEDNDGKLNANRGSTRLVSLSKLKVKDTSKIDAQVGKGDAKIKGNKKGQKLREDKNVGNKSTQLHCKRNESKKSGGTKAKVDERLLDNNEREPKLVGEVKTTKAKEVSKKVKSKEVKSFNNGNKSTKTSSVISKSNKTQRNSSRAKPVMESKEDTKKTEKAIMESKEDTKKTKTLKTNISTKTNVQQAHRSKESGIQKDKSSNQKTENTETTNSAESSTFKASSSKKSTKNEDNQDSSSKSKAKTIEKKNTIKKSTTQKTQKSKKKDTKTISQVDGVFDDDSDVDLIFQLDGADGDNRRQSRRSVKPSNSKSNNIDDSKTDSSLLDDAYSDSGSEYEPPSRNPLNRKRPGTSFKKLDSSKVPKKSISNEDYQSESDSSSEYEPPSRTSFTKKSLQTSNKSFNSQLSKKLAALNKATQNKTDSDSESEFDLSSRTPMRGHLNMSRNAKPSLKRLTEAKREIGDVRSDVMQLVKGRIGEQKQIDQNRLSKKVKLKLENDSDSDCPPEPIKKKNHDSDDDFVPKVKVKRRVQLPSFSVLSDNENDLKKGGKKGNDVWVEVFSEMEEKWISVDVTHGQIHCVKEIYQRATHPVSYVVAWNNANTLKDITQRYCQNFNTVTRKQRIDSKWWYDSLKPFMGTPTPRDKEEDDDLARQQLDQPLPKAISEYKNHPLYALRRHLLKFEAIYPPEPTTLGFIRGEAVYPRGCIFTLHSREIWLKQAKVVKLGEKPYKIVKARPKYDRLSNKMITGQDLEIFGPWQVQDYDPPTAQNGIVPKNAFGNVDLFKASMIPKGCVHLKLPGLNKIARRMNIDIAAAIVGFDFHGGWSHPVYDGFIVCKEYEDQLICAWELEQDELDRKEEEKIEKRVYGNWKKLIKGLLIRERLKAKYDFGEPSGSKPKGKK